MARTMSVPCRRDLACYRNYGHDGGCAYATPETVPQPTIEARAPLDVERLARALHQLQSGPHRDRNPVAGEGRDTCDLDAAELAREYAKEPQP